MYVLNRARRVQSAAQPSSPVSHTSHSPLQRQPSWLPTPTPFKPRDDFPPQRRAGQTGRPSALFLRPSRRNSQASQKQSILLSHVSPHCKMLLFLGVSRKTSHPRSGRPPLGIRIFPTGAQVKRTEARAQNVKTGFRLAALRPRPSGVHDYSRSRSRPLLALHGLGAWVSLAISPKRPGRNSRIEEKMTKRAIEVNTYKAILGKIEKRDMKADPRPYFMHHIHWP